VRKGNNQEEGGKKPPYCCWWGEKSGREVADEAEFDTSK
jgi:hypothetical protein